MKAPIGYRLQARCTQPNDRPGVCYRLDTPNINNIYVGK